MGGKSAVCFSIIARSAEMKSPVVALVCTSLEVLFTYPADGTMYIPDPSFSTILNFTPQEGIFE